MTHSNAVSGDLSNLGFSLLNCCVLGTHLSLRKVIDTAQATGAPSFQGKKQQTQRCVYGVYVSILINIHIRTLFIYNIYIYIRHVQHQNIMKPP